MRYCYLTKFIKNIYIILLLYVLDINSVIATDISYSNELLTENYMILKIMHITYVVSK